MDHLDINQLDFLVKSKLWVGNELMIAEIFQRYLFLIQRDGPFPNFGTVEYWDTFLGTDEDDQRGGVAVTRSAAAASHTTARDTPATYRLTQTEQMYVKKFKTQGTFFQLEFTDDQTPLDTMRAALAEAIDRGFADGGENALVGLELNHRDLQRPILIPFSTRQKLTTDNVTNVVSAVLQSAVTVSIGASMTIKVVRIDRPIVGGQNFKFRLLGEKAPYIAAIPNTDNLCLPRSIVYAIARLHKDDSDEALKRWTAIKHGDRSRHVAQRNAARELLHAAGIAEGACGIQEVEKIQVVLPEYQIKVFDLHFNVIYESDIQKIHKIYLLFHNGHCSPILSITKFMQKSYFCDGCNIGFDHREDHRCANVCKFCFHRGLCVKTDWKLCTDCSRRFPSDVCFEQHKTPIGSGRKTTCDSVSICKDCGTQIKNRLVHHCGMSKCPSCKQYDRAEGHQWRCYIQRIQHKTLRSDRGEEEADVAGPRTKQRRSERSVKGFIFFDFETRQDDQFNAISYQHIVNYCVVQKVCDLCKDNWSVDSVCATCIDRQLVFDGDDCTDKFCNWLFTPANRNCIVFAHNSSGFDGQFLLKHITAKGLRPEIIKRGLSIMTMTVEGIKFLDSFSFLPMALAALPKAFGFEKDVVKGHFPHLFNRAENQSYVGPYPTIEYYSPGSLKPDARKKLLAWHQEQAGKEFNFKQKMHRYCVDDVNILRKAVLEFRRMFILNTTVDPYLASATIASACSQVFRRVFLAENTIAIVPNEGYRRNDKQSIVAIQWLKWVAHSRGLDIQHAKNRGEKTIGPYKVDGYCEAENKIYEFHGCIWHGCMCIKNRQKQVPGGKMTVEQAYNRTLTRKHFFVANGYTHDKIWSCTYNQQLRVNPEMAAFVNSLDMTLPLAPRGAFFGGRTNAIVLEKKAVDGEKIEYADFVSLYPTVLKNRPFPLGHPRILTEGFEQITAAHNQYFGLIKCEVLAPRELYHPVLPVRCGGKLVFPLCWECALHSTENCRHTDEQRLLKGEWVTVELDRALAVGYQIHKIHEIWTYNHISNPKTRGKFGQRNNLPQCKYFTSSKEFAALTHDPSVHIDALHFCGEDVICVNYTVLDAYVDALPYTNPVIAAFTTAWARLELYGVLEKLGRRVLYFDTDSVIYTVRDGEWRTQFGEKLGELTNELAKDYGEGAYCDHFIGAGPKNYALSIVNGDMRHTIVKVRGFALNFDAAKNINFDAIKDMMGNFLNDGSVDKIRIDFPQITRTTDHTILTRQAHKMYKIVYSKRCVLEDGTTVPWGY